MDLPIPLVHIRAVLPGRLLCRRLCPDAAALALAWPWRLVHTPGGGWLADGRLCGAVGPPARRWTSGPAEQGQQGPAPAAVQQVSVGFWLGNR